MAPKKQTLLNFVTARKELLDLHVGAGMVAGTPKFESRSKEATKAITAQVNLVKRIDADEATEVTKVLVDAPLTEDDRSTLMDLVMDKVDTPDDAAGPTSAHGAKQSVNMPHLYLTSCDWEVVTSSSKTLHERMVTLVRRFVGLGLYYPDEFAVRNIVAVSLTDQGVAESLLGIALKCEDTFKQMVKSSRATRPRSRELCSALGCCGCSVAPSSRG